MRIAAIYPYVDAQGHLLHETVRYIPKSFRQRQPDPAHPGQYIWDLEGITRVLYHLPQVLASVRQGEVIYLCEGEKDADNLQQAFGVTTTTNAMGAGNWRDTYTETLRGASVIILTHHDKAGADHALKVTSALVGAAAQLKVVASVHTEAPKSDVSDWLAAGGTRAAFEAAIEAISWGTHPTPPPKPMPTSAHFHGWATGTPAYDRVVEALSYISNADVPYHEWVTLGMALHSLGETWAQDLWDSWSRQSSKYNARRQAHAWQSFRSGGKVQIGTLFHRAQQGGWAPPRATTRTLPDMTRRLVTRPTPMRQLTTAPLRRSFNTQEVRP